MVKKFLAILAMAGIMTTTAAMAETVQIDGYGMEGVPAQFSIDNVVGEIDGIEIKDEYYEYKTYEAKSPAKITMMVDDIFMFEVFDTLNNSTSIWDGAMPVTHDGFGPEYNYVPYEEQVEGQEYRYDEMIIAEGSPIEVGRSVTLTAPGVYYAQARYGAMAGAASAVIVIKEGPALYTTSKVMIDGNEVAFEAYNINGNNYFKLRDVAMALKDTKKKFNIHWSAEAPDIISITFDAYKPVGGELTAGDSLNKTAYMSSQRIEELGDGARWSVKPYNINGNNYFKLRDLGKKVGFAVDWDAENNCIMIDTTK